MTEEEMESAAHLANLRPSIGLGDAERLMLDDSAALWMLRSVADEIDGG